MRALKAHFRTSFEEIRTRKSKWDIFRVLMEALRAHFESEMDKQADPKIEAVSVFVSRGFRARLILDKIFMSKLLLRPILNKF